MATFASRLMKKLGYGPAKKEEPVKDSLNIDYTLGFMSVTEKDFKIF